MKFLNNLSFDTFQRLGAMLMLLFVFALSVFATSYASTQTKTSNPAKYSPTGSSTNWNRHSETDGVPFVQSRQSTGQQNKFTNFTGLKTQASSAAANRQLNFGSAARIQGRSNSSTVSTIFTFRNSRITRANHYEIFWLNGISKTARLCSAGNLRTNWRTFAQLPERNLKTLPIDRRKQSFRPPSPEYGIGRTSAVSAKRKSSSPELSRRSTRAQPRFAES